MLLTRLAAGSTGIESKGRGTVMTLSRVLPLASRWPFCRWRGARAVRRHARHARLAGNARDAGYTRNARRGAQGAGLRASARHSSHRRRLASSYSPIATRLPSTDRRYRLPARRRRLPTKCASCSRYSSRPKQSLSKDWKTIARPVGFLPRSSSKSSWATARPRETAKHVCDAAAQGPRPAGPTLSDALGTTATVPNCRFLARAGDLRYADG